MDQLQWELTDYLTAAQIKLHNLELEIKALRLISEAVAGKRVDKRLNDVLEPLADKLWSTKYWGKPQIYYSASDLYGKKCKRIRVKWYVAMGKNLLINPPEMQLPIPNDWKKVPDDKECFCTRIEKLEEEEQQIRDQLQTFTENFAQYQVLTKCMQDLSKRMQAITDIERYHY